MWSSPIPSIIRNLTLTVRKLFYSTPRTRYLFLPYETCPLHIILFLWIPEYLDLFPFFNPLSDPHVVNVSSFRPNGKDIIYIGRPTKFSNPYKASIYGRKLAIILFEDYLFHSGLINDVYLLKDKLMACHCSPLACHGDILAKYIYNPY